MSNRIYVLQVGINDYPPDVGKLSGCLNDVDNFHDYLRDSGDSSRLAVEVLKDDDATRGNIIEQFRKHLGRAGEGDVALFQYCGHGARWASAEAFKALYPNGKDEGLVCIDSRSPGGYDLADKELAVLIAEVARNNPHLAVILDCCHSGSGTRGADGFSGLRARTTHEVTSERPLESYLDGFYANQQTLSVPAARHVLMAACERKQKAQEDPTDNCGVFTSTLIEVLRKSQGDLSYADLFVRSRAAVHTRAFNQNPVFETYGQFNANSGFLGRTASSPASRYVVCRDQGDWIIECGAIQGIPTAADKVVTLTLYPEDNPTREAGTASITRVGAQDSEVSLDFNGDETLRYRAEITSLPGPALTMHFPGEAADLASIQAELNKDDTTNILLTDIEKGTHYSIIEQEGYLQLNHLDSDRMVQRTTITGGDLGVAASLLRPVLKHVSQWEGSLVLQNPGTRMDPNLVDLQFAEMNPKGGEVTYEESEVTLYPETEGNELHYLSVRLRARNRTGQTLHMALVHYSTEYRVLVLQNEAIEPGEAFTTLWGEDEETQYIRLDENSNEANEYFKLIVSTEKVDGFLLEMDELKMGETVSGGKRGVGHGEPRKKPRHRKEWFTKDMHVRLVRTANRVGAQDVSLAGGKIIIKGHGAQNDSLGLSASLSLGAANPGGRSTDNGADFYRGFEAQGLELINLSGERGDIQNTLELSDIRNAESLRDTPLEIQLNIPVQEDEGIIPLVHDGQHVMLGGEYYKDDEGNTHITIDHIPKVPTESRSLGSALKLYFFKTYLRRNNVNQLRWVEIDDQGDFEHHSSNVAAKVADAKNILLLIHGIIGDTDSLARGASACQLGDKFDLILSYDYENLSTPIDNTARQLKANLAEVGLHENDDKQLTLLAHSMGGLVSRWFIEREYGNDIVDHLVMCGTPNQGSPFGHIDGARKVVGMLTTVALNYIPTFIPFGSPLLMLLKRSEKVTPTLEQMNPASDFIQALNASKDPAIPYTVLAGDVETYKEPSDQFFANLLDKVGKSITFDTLFAGNANDIAVGVDSILHTTGERRLKPVHFDVACHHLNYFDSATGQQALMAIDWHPIGVAQNNR